MTTPARLATATAARAAASHQIATPSPQATAPTMLVAGGCLRHRRGWWGLLPI